MIQLASRRSALVDKRININSKFVKDILIGELREQYSASGNRILRYSVDFRHKSLAVHKDVSAPDLGILQNKVDALMASWDLKMHTEMARRATAVGKQQADSATVEATTRLESLKCILSHALEVDDTVKWDSLKDHSPPPKPARFTELKPSRKCSPKPIWHSPKITIIDLIFGNKAKKLAEEEKRFERLLANWSAHDTENKVAHDIAVKAWESRRSDHDRRQEETKNAFLERQQQINHSVDELEKAYAGGDTSAIIKHASMILEASDYGGLFEKSYEMEYDRHNRTLLLEYDLPSPDVMPTLKSVRFVQSTGEMKESHISDRDRNVSFESVCYQTCLRTLHELFEADVYDHIEKILFNGFVTAIDLRTGQEVRNCLMSVLVDRGTFLDIDLSRVDPKICFKNLKGVSGARLSAFAPIAPVMDLNREDRRFIDGREIEDSIDEATNLAEMDWVDFEHLVRNFFEKEFAARGGEVRVTRSSKDGGVDAVAFDPDPISGGKIVIQAKRYTKTVGVAAVRDLYGTTVNEGANKGILVTTADYGPDAYSFASGKPITLMTGANLLHLLEQHGMKAKIDLQAAREARFSS